MSAGSAPPPLTLGTAGHIDHGKTALVGALTGRDTDRLPEEKARGISIELGYASLELPGGRRLSVVDVPGHERFVRTMVAGASGIDLFMLCVAADDGVMPQTREHLTVLRRLDVSAGVVAVTKSDLADPAPAVAECAELLPGVPAVAVSAIDGAGLEELRRELATAAAALPGRAGAHGPARLHVDRSFTLRGIGTVVTGTLWAGSLARGDSVTILPRGLRARVRSVQVHDEGVERAAAGQRVALALSGPGWREIARGDVVCLQPESIAATHLADVLLRLEPGVRPLRRGERLHVHHGTREAPARVVPLEAHEIAAGAGGFAQLRLEAPLMPVAGDRLILRRLAPPDTIGGGVVLDPRPRKHGPGEEVLAQMRALARGEPPPDAAAPPSGPPGAGPGAGPLAGPPGGAPAPGPGQAAPAGPPEALGDAALRLLALLASDGTEPRADGDLAAEAGLGASEAAAAFAQLEQTGQAIRTGRNLHFHRDPLEGLVARVVALSEREGAATIASVRDELGTSRRYAQAILEHLDTARVTLRRGDEHVLRRRRGA